MDKTVFTLWLIVLLAGLQVGCSSPISNPLAKRPPCSKEMIPPQTGVTEDIVQDHFGEKAYHSGWDVMYEVNRRVTNMSVKDTFEFYRDALKKANSAPVEEWWNVGSGAYTLIQIRGGCQITVGVEEHRYGYRESDKGLVVLQAREPMSDKERKDAYVPLEEFLRQYPW